MRSFHVARRTLVVGAAAAILAGCSGARSSGPTALLPSLPVQKEQFKSFMLPQARDAKYLLYISSFYYGIVHVFDFRKRTEVGLLAGLAEATGQCVDANGDVWIALAVQNEMVEYPRASVKQIRALHTLERPWGCSVAPDGDLAVANFDGRHGEPGSVEVFKGASGTPIRYACSGFNYYSSPGYDDKGNLFVEAQTNLQHPVTGVCMLPAGGMNLNPMKLNVGFHFGGGAMWDGKHMTLADQYYSSGYRVSTNIYRVVVSSPSELKVVGTTRLTDARVPQPFILGSKNTPENRQEGTVVVGPDNDHITRWKYPSGVKNSVPYVIGEVPFGESISIGI